jgi:multiple sugar transport system substrate-binding protein
MQMAHQSWWERTRRRQTAVRGVVLLAGAAALALSACGSSSHTSSGTTTQTTAAAPAAPATTAAAPGTSQSGTIQWWASPITTSGADPRAVLISAFEKQYPNIHVQLVSAPNDTDTNRAALTTQISGGSAHPDVYMGDVIWPAQFAAHQFAAPLSDYVPESYWNTFAPGLVSGATYKGKVYGAPFFEDQGFLYYRKDLLTAAGLTPPKTFEELMTDAQTLQTAGKVKYGFVWQGASYEGTTCNFMEYLTSAGGAVLNSSATSSTVNSPQGLQALTFMKSLITSGVTPSAVSTFQESQAMAAFSAGQSAFLRNWDYAYSTSQSAGSAVIGKVGVEPMPTFTGHPTPGYSNIGGWNLYVNPHSSNKAADLTFIRWMTGTQAQTILATQFSEIPTNQSVRTSPAVVGKNAVLAVVPQTRLVPRPAQTPDYPAVSQAIYQHVNAVLAGSESPQSALHAMNSGINTALSGSGL